MTRRQADLALLLATALWGTSFVAVKRALADATPLAFLTVRFGIAALALAPGTRFRPRPTGRELSGGALLGGLVAVGFIAQTAGLVTTTPSRSAFIVAVSSVLAPVIALALLGERPRWVTAVALAVATLGIYLLTAPDAGGLNRGDLLTLICAVCFGGQIVAVTELTRHFDSRRLVFVQIAARRAPLHGPVRKHHLLPAADAGPASDVERAGRADLLLRAAVRRGHVVAHPRGAPRVVAVEWRSVDSREDGAGGTPRG
ncbi:MAG: hypothetical protein DMD57_12240 [Gemmatimonadetes bacterium]|nr:MAG: hypothetical protein DMD57_12240 [Gemmatimonadota bacterium]